jgi:hypothetical protein
VIREDDQSSPVERINLLPDAEQFKLFLENVLEEAQCREPDLRRAFQCDGEHLLVVADREDRHAGPAFV